MAFKYMLTHIENKQTEEFATRERCFIREILNDAQSPDLSVARCRVETGVITELHSLAGTQETYLIERGQGLMDDGACVPIAVGPGDSITIPPDHPQRIANTGEYDLVFTVVCTPRFKPDCYVPLPDCYVPLNEA